MFSKRICQRIRVVESYYWPDAFPNLFLFRRSHSSSSIVQLDSNLNFELSRIRKLALLQNSRNAREREKQTVLKNLLLIKRAVTSNVKISDIFFQKDSYLKDFPSDVLKNIKLHKVSPEKLEVTQGNKSGGYNNVTAICDIPSTFPTTNHREGKHLPVTVVLDNIRNYENMGSILKIFECFKCQRLILTKGCVDIWNPKTIECANGVILNCHHLIIENQTLSDIRKMIPNDHKILLADINHPHLGHKRNKSNMPTKYTDVDYKSYPGLVLIIGGETEGISTEASALCKQRDGLSVYIPIRNEINSLNAGVATSILLSEVARQLDFYS